MPTNNEPKPTETETARAHVSWDDVMRSRKPLGPLTEAVAQTRFCIKDVSYDEQVKLPSGGSIEVKGRAVCMEKMTRQMSLLVKRQDAEVMKWANGAVGDWLRTWQMVSVKGSKHADRYMDSSWCAQHSTKGMFRSAEEESALMVITPGDEVARNVVVGTLGGAISAIEPVRQSAERIVMSWRDGSQQRLLMRCWRDIEQLRAMTLLGSMVDSAVRMWNRAQVDDDLD
ncbi:hypothetical protein GGF43_005221 [Coemansia sp. RSA 2618]|nr:hypothetical protein GGF43_005221 [Coemansia sp. RSA 2618]